MSQELTQSMSEHIEEAIKYRRDGIPLPGLAFPPKPFTVASAKQWFGTGIFSLVLNVKDELRHATHFSEQAPDENERQWWRGRASALQAEKWGLEAILSQLEHHAKA